MLTLTREPGQKIVVGDDIVITVVSVSENGRVRLGIEAPRQIRIDREEVLERIQNENIEAGAGGTASRWAAYAARRANRQASAGATSPSVGDPGQSRDAAQRPKRLESLAAPR